jgi:hypothetical protein
VGDGCTLLHPLLLPFPFPFALALPLPNPDISCVRDLDDLDDDPDALREVGLAEGVVSLEPEGVPAEAAAIWRDRDGKDGSRLSVNDAARRIARWAIGRENGWALPDPWGCVPWDDDGNANVDVAVGVMGEFVIVANGEWDGIVDVNVFQDMAVERTGRAGREDEDDEDDEDDDETG